jgi:hypothetical protein
MAIFVYSGLRGDMRQFGDLLQHYFGETVTLLMEED